MDILLYILAFVIVIIAQAVVTGTYNKYSKVSNQKGLTGFDVARKILDSNGLQDILIVETRGKLTDHYDPSRKVVRLSSEVYHDSSIASIAVAAHECGHVIQHKDRYAPIVIRNAIVPIVNLVSKLGYIVLVIGFIASVFNLIIYGLIALSITLVFQIITLPVEFNASKRAINILENDSLIESYEKSSVKSMLTSAALTYVASLVANLLEILRLFLIANRNRD
jgi:Zn-dependent membrane protease YugP